MTHTNLGLGNFDNMTQQKNYLYTKKKKIALMINCYNKAAKKDRRGGDKGRPFEKNGCNYIKKQATTQ